MAKSAVLPSVFPFAVTVTPSVISTPVDALTLIALGLTNPNTKVLAKT